MVHAGYVLGLLGVVGVLVLFDGAGMVVVEALVQGTLPSLTYQIICFLNVFSVSYDYFRVFFYWFINNFCHLFYI